MADPITFTASAIASLVFQKGIEAAGSETGKKFGLYRDFGEIGA